MSEDATGESDLAWETLDRETAYRCGGFSVRRDRVRLPDGTETAFDAVDEPDTAVILAFTPAERVVCVREWRHAVGRVARGLPAGTVEPDEEPGSAAARELAEETGYTAETVTHLATYEPANGLLDARHHAFVARGCRPTAAPEHDADETIRVEPTAFPDLRDAVLDGRIADGRTVTTVLRYVADQN